MINTSCLRSGCQYISCTNCEDHVTDYTSDLAAYAHKAWIGWTKYMFSKCVENRDGSLTIPVEFVKRWQRQMDIDYKDLPPEEQESDKKEAKKIMDCMDYWYFSDEEKGL